MNEPWLGWHFLPQSRCLSNDDGREVHVGETYVVPGPPVLCSHGLHACRRAVDALGYAPGPTVCRVQLGGEIVEENDKAAATERTVLAMSDATRTLYEFAIWCAEGTLRSVGVTDVRCWHALEVKRRWLDGATTDDELAAARASAGDAAWDTWAIAWNAAGVAAHAATRAAIGVGATRDTAWDSARNAAADAADAARNAADAAARGARNAADAAARGAARVEQNAELERRLLALFEMDVAKEDTNG